MPLDMQIVESLQYVKAHRGIEGIETADRLANDGAMKERRL